MQSFLFYLLINEADLEGNPSLDITINRDNIQPNVVLSNISVHPCVRKFDADSIKFGCVPPIHYFDLCTYTVYKFTLINKVQNVEKIPLRVFYQMNYPIWRLVDTVPMIVGGLK